ncbi:MAG: hypothetical protein R3E01_04460 [Pirellulaceae bacterium]|nr:hypothetical protein [Planctomycetales bacterium]
MLTGLAEGWTLEVERGPEWLFIRPNTSPGHQFDRVDLADSIWQLLDEHLVYRVVLELDNLPILNSYMIGQLVRLKRRIATRNGLFRIAGLHEANLDALRVSNLTGHLDHYLNRHEAVMGHVQRAK